MPRKSKADRLQGVWEEARKSFDRVSAAMSDERRQCLEDRRFCTIPGAQWEGDWAEHFANKPKIEVNKVHLAVMRVINEYRNNRISVNFEAKDGSSNLDLADVCDGLYRADEQDSRAEEAYDNAFEEAAQGGFGAWRLRNEYEDAQDEDNERQRICFEPVYDADTSVYFDLDAKRQDKSDARECWVLYSMTPQAFKEEYGEDPASWPKPEADACFDWSTPDVVFIAEYYRREEERRTFHFYVDREGEEHRFLEDELEDEDVQTEIAANAMVFLRKRRVERHRVHKYLMSGGGILEDLGLIAGPNIPVIPAYGKRWFIDNIERCMGVTRLAKDPQRLKNMQLSRLAETSALSGVEKPIFTPEQMAGHENMWSEDNIANFPYLLINPIDGPDGQPMIAGPVGYTKPPAVPQALAALLQITETDMSDILGRQEEGDKMVSNLAAQAVEMIQSRLDMQAYIYMSNFAKAMQRCGEVWLGMARELYVEEDRQMKSIGEMGNIETAVINQSKIDDEGNKVLANDLSDARFDVRVDVGPSFASRRDATVKNLTGVLQATQDPQTRQVIEAMILLNMEGEGLADVREFFRRRLVSMGALEPNEEERAAMEEAGSKPDPQADYLTSEAEKNRAQVREIESKAMRNVQEAEKADAETRKVEAETLKVLEEAQNMGAQPPGA